MEIPNLQNSSSSLGNFNTSNINLDNLGNTSKYTTAFSNSPTGIDNPNILTTTNTSSANNYNNLDISGFMQKLQPIIQEFMAKLKPIIDELLSKLGFSSNALPTTSNASIPNLSTTTGNTSLPTTSSATNNIGSPNTLSPSKNSVATTSNNISPNNTASAPTVSPTKTPIATNNTNISPDNTTFSTQRPNGPLSEQQSQAMAVQVRNRLMKDFNLTKEQASGLVGNLYYESAGMNPHINQFNQNPGNPYGDPTGKGGYGWAQWTGDRQTQFVNYSKARGLDPGSPEANYQFLKHELQTSESGTISALKNTSTTAQATTTVLRVFERADGVPAQPRVNLAANTFNWG